MEKTFKHELDNRVRLGMSGEEGLVVGRSEYTNMTPRYLTRYVAADGRQVEDWLAEDALEAV